MLGVELAARAAALCGHDSRAKLDEGTKFT